MIYLTKAHLEIIQGRLQTNDVTDDLKIVFASAAKTLKLNIHRDTIAKIVSGRNLTTPTVKNLQKILRQLHLDDLAEASWLENLPPRVTARKPSIATFVDPNLDKFIQYQHEIRKITGYYAVYRRHASSEVSSSATALLVRELLYIVGRSDDCTDMYLVTKKGYIYKGAALRTRDIWKIDFFRIFEELTTITRTMSLQVDTPALDRNIIGGVMLRATDERFQGAATDLIAVKLPSSTRLESLGEQIVTSFRENKRLFNKGDPDVPATVLRLDHLKTAERAIYDILIGTIIAPNAKTLGALELDDIYSELPLP